MRTALLIGVIAAISGPLAAQDTITWTDGTTTKNVTVTGFNLREVEYKSRGVTETKSSDHVAILDITKVKDKYKRAYGASFGDRVGQFLMIAESLKKDPFLCQFGYHEAAQMLLANGQYGDAFGVLADLEAACPDSGYLPLTFRAKLDFYLSREQKKDVAAVAAKYSTATQTQGYPSGYALEANYYRGLARAMNGELNVEQLRKEMSSIVRQADPNFPLVASRARLAIADSLRAEGKKDEAKREYTDLIGDEKTVSMVRNSAWLGMGHVHVSAGSSADKGPFRDALLAFLRVYLDEESNDAIKAEALYWGSEAAKKWGGEGAGRYAKVLRGRLLNQHAESPWAKK